MSFSTAIFLGLKNASNGTCQALYLLVVHAVVPLLFVDDVVHDHDGGHDEDQLTLDH